MLGHILMTAINAVLPILLMITLGQVLRRCGLLNEDFLKQGNQLVFKVCLPCMLFVNIYNVEGIDSIRWDIVLYCVAMLCVIFCLGYFISVAATDDPKRRGVIWQCCFRSNFAIIGLSLASALGGEEATALGAVVSAFAIPCFNVFSVIALTLFVGKQDTKKFGVKEFLLDVLKNPLTIGVLAGLLALVLRSLQNRLFGEVVFSLQRDTKFLHTTLSNIKAITSPLALLVMGGQFEFSAVKGMRKEILAGTLGRTVMVPVVAIGCAVLLNACTDWFHCSSTELPTLIALFGSPVAVASAIMAGAMGSDKQLATQLVVWTCIASIPTIFLTVCILMGTGLLVV